MYANSRIKIHFSRKFLSGIFTQKLRPTNKCATFKSTVWVDVPDAALRAQNKGCDVRAMMPRARFPILAL